MLKLFKIMLHRNVCPVTVRLIFNIYEHLTMQINELVILCVYNGSKTRCVYLLIYCVVYIYGLFDRRKFVDTNVTLDQHFMHWVVYR